MASLVLFVLALALSSFLDNRVVAQNNITRSLNATAHISTIPRTATPTRTSTTAPATSTATIKPTPTTQVSPASSTVSFPKFETNLSVEVELTGSCDKSEPDVLIKRIEDIYKEVYDLKNVEITTKNDSNEKCTIKFNIKFGKGLTKKDIIAKLENDTKSTAIKIVTIEVKVEGVELGEYKPNHSHCKAKCCNGAGGEIDLARSCGPRYKCVNYRLKKTVEDCSDVCDEKVCDAMFMKVSLVVLILAGLLNWFMNE